MYQRFGSVPEDSDDSFGKALFVDRRVILANATNVNQRRWIGLSMWASSLPSARDTSEIRKVIRNAVRRLDKHTHAEVKYFRP